MKKFLSFSLICAVAGTLLAQQPFKKELYNESHQIFLHINLYEEKIVVPSMEMFGPMFGYLNGNIYGIWSATSAKIIDDKNATIRFSNDLGSETQEVLLTLNDDSTYTFKQVDGAVIKKVVKKKLVKIPQVLEFKIKRGTK